MKTRTRWRRALAVAAAVILAGTLAGISDGPTAGATTPPDFVLPPFPGDGGVLRLHLGAQNYFRFDAKNPSAPGYNTGVAEPLQVKGCNLAAPLPTSMTITPTPNGGSSQGQVGLVGGSIGVQVKGEGNGTPCGQVNGTQQALDLQLAGSLATKAMDFAELDIEGKFGVNVRANLYNDGQLVGTQLLVTGGPDSGPDSADGDNFRWRLPETGNVIFDEIKLSVDASTPNGAFSLEGGSDGTNWLPGGLGQTLGTSDSLFHIAGFDGTLACGGTANNAGTAGTPSATVTSQTGTGCEAVPYSLTVSNTDGLPAVAFQKIGGDSNVYRATIVWPVMDNDNPIPWTRIRYGDGPAHDLQWCDGTPASPILPAAGEFWCLVDQHNVIVGTDQIQQTEQLFGQGDPGAWK